MINQGAATSYRALQGRMVFHMRRRTLGSEFRASKIAEGIRNTETEYANSVGVYSLSAYVACTADVEARFEDGDSPFVRETLGRFVTWVKAFEGSPDYAAQWLYYLDELPSEIREAWVEAYDKANASLIPPEQKDGRYLTDEERNLAQDPTSPLVAPEKTSRKPS